MNRIVIILVVMMTYLVSCKGCLSKIYAVHEENEYLHLRFEDTSRNATSVLNYFDSVLKLDTANYEVKDSLDGVELGEDQRVVYFKKYPNEYYWVSINAFPCWIKATCNKNIYPYDWVYSRSKIKDDELKRIEKRFKDEILSKVPKQASYRN